MPEAVRDVGSLQGRALETKMQTWLDNGATLAWLVDPIDENVVVYGNGQTPAALVRPEVVKAVNR